MKFKYLVLQISLFSIASLFGANAAADVKASRAEATTNEADAKVNQNKAFPYFKEWVDMHRCNPEDIHKRCEIITGNGTIRKTENATSLPCGHCTDMCVNMLQSGQPCWHMTNIARTTIMQSSRIGNRTDIASFIDDPTYGMVALPSEAAQKIAETITELPKVLAPIISSYIPERVIHFVISNISKHPISKYDTRYQCTYNLDTDHFVIHREQYVCFRYSPNGELIYYVSDQPIAPDCTHMNKALHQ